MPAIEPVRGFTVPTVAGDVGVWGGELNATINSAAAILGTQTVFNSSTVGSNTTVTSSQAQSARLAVLNTSSSPFQLNLPSSNFANGLYNIAYVSSQLQPLTITGGSSIGAGVALQAVIPGAPFIGSSTPAERLVYSDGLGNVFFADSVLQNAPTVQRFLAAGSTTYFPTSPAVQRIRVREAGAGGGGAAAISSNPGSSGGTTSFAGWTALGGSFGSSFNGGAGGAGGVNGAGTLIMRLNGGDGNDAGSATGLSGSGGANPFGGRGKGSLGLGGVGAPNTGAGGGGAGGGNPGTTSGGGGAAGEYVEFWITAPSSSGLALTVGAPGAGGAPGGGGAGAAGQIVVEEFYI